MSNGTTFSDTDDSVSEGSDSEYEVDMNKLPVEDSSKDKSKSKDESKSKDKDTEDEDEDKDEDENSVTGTEENSVNNADTDEDTDEEVDEKKNTKESRSLTEDDSESNGEKKESETKNDVVFSEPPVLDDNVTSVSFDELYNQENVDMLVSDLKEKSNFIKPLMKILILGLQGEYIKFQPKRDVFGFLTSKSEQEKMSMYQTATCKAAIHHVNVPSLTNALKVDLTKSKDIFETATEESDAAGIMEKLISNANIPSEPNDLNTISVVRPLTPYLEMLLTDTDTEEGTIVVLEGDNMANAFDVFKLKSLLVDDVVPKKMMLSNILNMLADAGAKNIIVVNLCTSSETPNVIGPTESEDEESDNESTTSASKGGIAEEPAVKDNTMEASAIPAVDETTPAAEMATPAAETETPAADMATPAADMATPAADMATPAADTAEMATPAADTAVEATPEAASISNTEPEAQQPPALALSNEPAGPIETENIKGGRRKTKKRLNPKMKISFKNTRSSFRRK